MQGKTVKLFKAVLLLLSVSFFSTLLTVNCFAEQNARVWKNEETGFESVVCDDAGLLNELTGYANIAIYTVSSKTSLDEFERSREKRKELFRDTDSAVFMIDMYLRKIVIHRYGSVEKYFTNAMANNITNNVASYATQKNYYLCCSTAVEQMLKTIEGESIPSPMKYLGNGCIALSLSALLIFILYGITSGTYFKNDGEAVVRENDMIRPVSITDDKITLKSETKKDVPPPSSGDGGGSSCSSCGSSCSSCGSSCSSCGSSCGSSSF